VHGNADHVVLPQLRLWCCPKVMENTDIAVISRKKCGYIRIYRRGTAAAKRIFRRALAKPHPSIRA